MPVPADAAAAVLGLRLGCWPVPACLDFLGFAADVRIAEAKGDGLAVAPAVGCFFAVGPGHAMPSAADGRTPRRASAAMDALALPDACAATGRLAGNSQTHSPSAAMPPARITNRRRQ